VCLYRSCVALASRRNKRGDLYILSVETKCNDALFPTASDANFQLQSVSTGTLAPLVSLPLSHSPP
jgi:hypothetical protein